MILMRMVIIILETFCCSGMNNTPSACDFAHPGENIGISKADCSQHGMETMKTAPPVISDFVGDCGIDDLPSADCTRMMATAVMHHGSFENPLLMNGLKLKWKGGHILKSLIIDHVIQLCDFLFDSVMVKYIHQQQWLTLPLVITVGVYCCTKAYHDDYAAAFPTTPLKSLKQAWSCDSISAPVNGSGTSMVDPVEIHEFH
jgi:hypothetical protein